MAATLELSTPRYPKGFSFRRVVTPSGRDVSRAFDIGLSSSFENPKHGSMDACIDGSTDGSTDVSEICLEPRHKQRSSGRRKAVAGDGTTGKSKRKPSSGCFFGCIPRKPVSEVDEAIERLRIEAEEERSGERPGQRSTADGTPLNSTSSPMVAPFTGVSMRGRSPAGRPQGTTSPRIPDGSPVFSPVVCNRVSRSKHSCNIAQCGQRLRVCTRRHGPLYTIWEADPAASPSTRR
eukprot:GHVU01218090.1.p1 GENE.GHVU01218090.1~~GHVU01218090.1.p1  ORF type:complete len:235 (-),score=6.36 GHVU01218090.1:3018-3722(-)